MITVFLAVATLIGSCETTAPSCPLTKALVNRIIELTESGDVDKATREMEVIGNCIDALKLSNIEKREVFRLVVVQLNEKYGTNFTEEQLMQKFADIVPVTTE